MSATDGHECKQLAKISQRDGHRDMRLARPASASWRCLPPPPPTPQRSAISNIRTTGNRIHVETSAEARAFLQVFML
jgi:hypothetical protein